jgi:hypothetical protein
MKSVQASKVRSVILRIANILVVHQKLSQYPSSLLLARKCILIPLTNLE